MLLARTHHALPEKATVKGILAGKAYDKEYRIELDAGVGAALVPRLWAAEKVRRLLGEDGSEIIRVTEDGYRFVPPRDFLFVIPR